MALPDKLFGTWRQIQVFGDPFICAHCEAEAAPHYGFRIDVTNAVIALCPRCNYPTLLVGGQQIPAAPVGQKVTALPAEVERFYSEARRCGSVEAWDAVALLSRTLLMHVAVDKQVARLGDYFEPCVNGLDTGGWIPTGGRQWVDEVRRVGNKAAHRADPVTREEAELIMHFVELLLRNVYEAPARFAARAPLPPPGGGGQP